MERSSFPPIPRDERLKPYILKGVEWTGKCLGRGAFGVVLELQLQGGAVCAGKKIHDTLVDSQNVGVQHLVEKFIAECELMSTIRHPNIVTYYGIAIFDDSSIPVLVMEQLERSLDSFLENTQETKVPFSIRLSILHDVAKGLVFLHSYNPPIVHRDLTARNILLTTTKQAKVADLGNSRIIDTEVLSRTLSEVPGTLPYMPPEAFVKPPNYDASLDIFSFGHVSLFVLGHQSPNSLLQATYHYPGSHTPSKLCARSEVERRSGYFLKLESNNAVTLQVIEIVKACLDNLPASRPTASQIAELLADHLEDHAEEYQMVLRRMGNLEVSPMPATGGSYYTTERRPNPLTASILVSQIHLVFKNNYNNLLHSGWSQLYHGDARISWWTREENQGVQVRAQC